MQHGLFKFLLENSNFNGNPSELLHMIETDEDSINIVKTAMYNHICDDDIQKCIQKTLFDLKDILKHIQVIEVDDKL